MSPQLKNYYENKEKRLMQMKEYKKKNREKCNRISNKSYHKCKKLKGYPKAKKPLIEFEEVVDEVLSRRCNNELLKDYVR